MNYTNPENIDYEDTPKDWLNSSLIFASALGHLLKENEGVVVDHKGDMNFNTLFDNDTEEIKKVIVYHNDDKVRVIQCDDDVPEGTLIWMETSEEQANFLNALKSKERGESIDDALDLLFHELEERQLEGDIEFCDTFIKNVKFDEHTTDILIGILTITLPWKDKLINRSEFFIGLTCHLLTGDEPDTVEELLRGLK